MNTYFRLLNYIKPFKKRFIVAAIAGVVAAATNSIMPAILYVVFNGLQNMKEVVIEDLPHLPFLNGLRFDVVWIPVIVAVSFALRSFFEYIAHYQMASVGIRAIRKLRDDLYEHLVHLSHDFFAKGRTGDFLSRIMNDVNQIQGAITNTVFDIVKQPFTIVFLIYQVFGFGGKYAVLALVVFPIVVIPIVWLGRKLRKITQRMQERTADITSFIGETLSGFHIVKAFNREDYEAEHFKRINKQVFLHFKKTIKFMLLQRPIIEFMGAAGAGVAIYFAIGNLPLDKFASFVGSLFLLYDPIKKMSKVNSTIQQSLAAGARIFEILDAKPTIQNKENAEIFKEELQTVSFENVSFSYDGESQVLNNLSLSVNKGEALAIVGLSGAGKTTLVKLLPRFYDPTKGSIKLNGKDLRDLDLVSIRNQMSMVSQETVLFNGTVRDNIAYHNFDAPLEEVKRAAELAHAAHFIDELPEGYDTQLGERGMKLSGGQRQRISIARAIFKDSPILILDEATSHLDTHSEREVQEAIENLMEGRTVFVIAHRLSTIQRANRIIVMQDGKIIEEGTNAALISKGGVYKQLHDLQFNL